MNRSQSASRVSSRELKGLRHFIAVTMFTTTCLLLAASGCDGDTPIHGSPGGPAALIPTVDGGADSGVVTPGNVAVVKTVKDLKLIPISQRDPASIYVLRGYYAEGDTSDGQLVWLPNSIVPEDCTFVFRPGSNVCPTSPNTSTASGRFVRLERGTFDARKGGIKNDGTVGQFSRLKKVYADASNFIGITPSVSGAGGAGGAAAVIDTLWLGPGRIDVSDQGVLDPRPGSTSAVAIKGAGTGNTTLVGPPHGSAAGQFGIFSTRDTATTRSWTQDLSAPSAVSTTVFGALPSVSGLNVGDWVVMNFGVDRTDGEGPFETLITSIISINTTAKTITVSSPLRELVPNITPTQPKPQNRLYNVHDLTKLTGVFNGFEMSDLAIDNMFISPNTVRATHLHDLHFPYSQRAFLPVYDENTVVERITADKIDSVTSLGGIFYAGWSHLNTVIRDVEIRNLQADFFTSELQSRGMVFDNLFLNLTNPPKGFVMVSGENPIAEAHFGYVALSGTGGPLFGGLEDIDNLWISGSDGAYQDLSVFVSASQVNNSIFVRGNRYTEILEAPTMTIPLPSSGVVVAPYPLHGLPRHVRIRPSAGLTFTATPPAVPMVVVFQHATTASGTTLLAGDASPYLVAGQFNEWNGLTLLDHRFPSGGISDYQRLVITVNTPPPPGSYLEVSSEFFVSTDSVSTQPPAEIVGSGPPTASASFFSQRYYDSTNHKYYLSIGVGSGSADWVLSGG